MIISLPLCELRPIGGTTTSPLKSLKTPKTLVSTPTLNFDKSSMSSQCWLDAHDQRLKLQVWSSKRCSKQLPHSTEYHSSDFFRFQRCQRAIRRPRSPRYATRNLCQYPARIVSWCFLEQQSQRTSKRHSGNMVSSRKNLILVLVSFGWNWSSFLFFLSYLTL